MATCGIYKLTNLLNGKSYIGQSVTVENRVARHFKEAEKLLKELRFPLHRAIRKHGAANFSSEVVLVVQREDLDFFEKDCIQHYASMHPTGYNLTSGGSIDTQFSVATLKRLGTLAKAQMLLAAKEGKHPAQQSAHKDWLRQQHIKWKAEGTHPLSSAKARAAVSRRQKELLAAGLHHTQNPEWLRARSEEVKTLARKGLHNSQTPAARLAAAQRAKGNSYMKGKKRITGGKFNRAVLVGEQLPDGWWFGQTWSTKRKIV